METNLGVLVIDDEPEDRRQICSAFVRGGWRVVAAVSSLAEVQAQVERSDILSQTDLAVIDWKLDGGRNGTEVLAYLRSRDPDIPACLLTSSKPKELSEIDTFLFDDWHAKELDNASWLSMFTKLCELRAQIGRIRRERNAAAARSAVGTAAEDLAEKHVPRLETIAESLMPVLILGESGTGKEGVAKAIHRRSGMPHLHAVNCAALGGGLAESILFGHHRGAFTGAEVHSPGAVLVAAGFRPPELTVDGARRKTFTAWLEAGGARLEPASGDAPAAYRFGAGVKRTAGQIRDATGTLFLDEVADLAPEAQALLLRFLDGNGFRPLGYHGPVLAPVVRIIAATSQIDKMLGRDANPVRRDLFHRLAGWIVRVESIHERAEEVVEVARAEVAKASGYRSRLTTDGADWLLRQIRAPGGPFRTGNLRPVLSCVRRAACLVAGTGDVDPAAMTEAMRWHMSDSGPSAHSPLPSMLSNLDDQSPAAVAKAVAEYLGGSPQRRSWEDWLREPLSAFDTPGLPPNQGLWGPILAVGTLLALGPNATLTRIRALFQFGKDRGSFWSALATALGYDPREAIDSVDDFVARLRRDLHPELASLIEGYAAKPGAPSGNPGAPRRPRAPARQEKR